MLYIIVPTTNIIIVEKCKTLFIFYLFIYSYNRRRIHIWNLWYLNLIIWYHLPHLNSNNISCCVLKYREINYPPRFFIAAFIFTTLSVKISSTLILCRSFQVDKCLYKSMANVLSKLYVNRINFFNETRFWMTLVTMFAIWGMKATI